MTVPVEADGALALYSAVGDACAGRRLGFGLRRATLAARFARHRGASDDGVLANWVAGALAEVGLVSVVVERDASAAERLYALADAPLHGAHIIASLPGVPGRTSDIVRWYREHDDGTGVPDGLRWDGIPADAGALGIADAFLAALDDPAEPRDTAEALFLISSESGRRFGIERLRAFREFLANTDDWRAPLLLALPQLDDDEALRSLAARLDARDPSTPERSERIAAIAGPLAERLGLDAVRTRRLSRLLALGLAADDLPSDAFDALSRFAREHRRTTAERAASIAASVPAYRDDASALAASADWYEDGPLPPLAAVLAVALVAAALLPAEAPRRLAAAAGTQLDPQTTHAYLAGLGAPT